MSPEALWRAVIEVVGDVCNGETGILKEAGGADEPRHCKVSFRRWCSSSKEPAHQRARRDVQKVGELANISYSRRTGEDRLEKLPAVSSSSREVDSELTENSTLSGIARVSHESTAELSPAGRQSNVDQSPDSAVPQGKHGMWCSQLELAQQRNCWNTGKFAHQ
jgi:hypothetical protein